MSRIDGIPNIVLPNKLLGWINTKYNETHRNKNRKKRC